MRFIPDRTYLNLERQRTKSLNLDKLPEGCLVHMPKVFAITSRQFLKIFSNLFLHWKNHFRITPLLCDRIPPKIRKSIAKSQIAASE